MANKTKSNWISVRLLFPPDIFDSSRDFMKPTLKRMLEIVHDRNKLRLWNQRIAMPLQLLNSLRDVLT